MEPDAHGSYNPNNQNWYDEADRPPVRPEPTPMGNRRRKGGFSRFLLGLLMVALLFAATAGVSRLVRETGWSAERMRQTIRNRLHPELSIEEAPLPAERSMPALSEAPQPEQRPQTVPEPAFLPIAASAPGIETLPSDDPKALSLQEIYSRLIVSVVSIATDTGSGTGIIMSEDGYIITNHHVIKDARSVSVLTSGDQLLEAVLVGSDELSDLAVLKVEGTFIPAEFGDSSQLRVGDTVVAIGDPLGVKLRGTMTNGIISAISRDLMVGERTMTLIQTNAALNNGNSGGPLINCYGQVIGVNTMKMSGMSGYYSSGASVEGLGFAIPMAVAKPIIDELIENGYVAGRPAIGISPETLPDAFRIYYRLPAGIYISGVTEGSDAQAKGILAGDIVTAINGTPVTTTEELNKVKNQFSAGDTVTLTVYRGGTFYEVEIMLIDQANVK